MTIEHIIILIAIAIIGLDQACEIRSERKRVNRLFTDLTKRVERLECKKQ